MTVTELTDEFSVLLLEESSTHADLFEMWLEGVQTKRAARPRDIFRVFDSTVAVACLSQSVLGEDEPDIRRFILNRNPYCQLILIASCSSPDILYEQHYDATIVRPTSREEFQTAVEKRLTYGMYSALLDEFYSLNAELVSLERAGDSEVDLDPDALQKRLQRVRKPLNQLTAAIDHADTKALLQSLNLHRKYLTEPAQAIDSEPASKYHPKACPNCKLPWGVDHRNDLGKGFTSIGAYVWRCSRCHDITHGSSPSDRRVARR
ncbi:hypothetical protein [Halorarum salinum]|uniref:Halobacterial output domain-containing protein n=1 Tax=Halorarum salinum TaxID=2743089 RepID=A0A7D5QBC1_9EURY|nr:hypothetical protein [Halobaculum salinum]QLG63216.1 hypothetical protein HUG12_16340 [Halobaculum salinum]